MPNPFGNLKTEGLEDQGDRLGGFAPLDSDIYTGKIKAMYAGKSDKGASFLAVIVDFEGKEYRETLYVTNKKGENYYMTKQDKKAPLPGFTVANDICVIATGKELHEMDFEDKVINIFDFEKKEDVPTSVPVVTEAIGQPIALGIIRQLENKKEKHGEEYVAIAETRESNNIDKVFHPELKYTVSEARKGATEPTFWDAWLKRNKGQTRDKREIKDGQTASGGAPKGNTPAAGSTRKSLFGK